MLCKSKHTVLITLSRAIHTHLRRALLNVPGNDSRKVEKAATLPVDTVVLDLEDGVPPDKKIIARENIVQFINKVNTFSKNKEFVIRMNHIKTDDGSLDINHCIKKCPPDTITSIILPKVDQIKDLDLYSKALENIPFKWLICIESPLAVLNLKEITSSYLGKISGLIFGAEDYCAASGITRTLQLRELYYPRAALVTTALAYGLDAIDMVTIDYKNMTVLKEESYDGKQLGFTGKQAIHPDQIQIIQETFKSSKESIDMAKRIIDGYERSISKGSGVFVLDGKVVDMPVVKWAKKIIDRSSVNE